MHSIDRLVLAPRRTQRGMTIVELMVAMVISLIGTVVIFQVFALNEGIRRETTNGADTQTSGLVALTTMERDLRMAGFGFNDETLVGCTVTMYDTKRTPNDVPTFQLVPVRITSNAGTTPDVLQVTYGTPSSAPARVAVTLPVDPAASTAPITPDRVYGFNAGDVGLLWESGSNCTTLEVTGLTASQIEHVSGNYFNPITGQNETARFNKPGGHGNAYAGTAGGTQISNLGQTPVMNEYTVRNDEADLSENYQLTVNNSLAEVPAVVPVAEQIVNFKAEYGLDDGNANGTVPVRDLVADDGIVDRYTTDAPMNWRQVIAVRLAIVTRSLQPEKPDTSTGDCNITADWGDAAYPIVWARGPDTPEGRPIDVRTQSDWRCYRYRVFESTVPLRNMLWKKEAL